MLHKLHLSSTLILALIISVFAQGHNRDDACDKAGWNRQGDGPPCVYRDSLQLLRAKGLVVFASPFSRAQGYGDGPFDPSEDQTTDFGQRPTLQANGLFLRVNGLDGQSCNECHVFVSQSTIPPTLGIGGVGGLSNTPLIMPSMIDAADSKDHRVAYLPGFDPDLPMAFDGVGDYNGRLANPPFLFGAGGVELLGKEMTADLQQALKKARRSRAGTVTPLRTHGIDFGSILSLGHGRVDLSDVTGILPEDITAKTPEEMLVIRPFGRKGENFSTRDFDRGAMQFHFGIQPVEVVGEGVDQDRDGVVNEVSIEQMGNLHIFGVTNPRPFMETLDCKARAGLAIFERIGCTSCHPPVLETYSRYLPLAFPEVPTDPWQNVQRFIDLKRVGFERASNRKGVQVPLFADLKRHDMGPKLAESLEKERREFRNAEFTTARLWGVADTKPYLHDGRATTLFEAIEQLGGEAQASRDAFVALSRQEQDQLLYFLTKLRTPVNPNQELVELVPFVLQADPTWKYNQTR